MTSSIQSQDPAHYEDLWRASFLSHGETKPGSAESKSMWNKKAPSFAKKPIRSDYITQLINLLNLHEGESVFDMGCGSGTLAIPLAKTGHNVTAVDFSDGMLEQLRAAAEAEDVQPHRLHMHLRSWQEDWRDLPSADVAVASRSFVTADLADSISKLESKANRRVAMTVKAGDLPYHDSRILEALGRRPETRGETDGAPRSAPHGPDELACLVGYLFAIGRLPSVTYIEYPGKTCRPTREKLHASMIEAYRPTEAELPLLEAFLEDHIVYNEEHDDYRLDYDRTDRWALVMWDVPGAAHENRPPHKQGDRVAAKACIFKDGRMLVLYKPEDGRNRSAVPDREEDLPGGCVEEGETLEEALKREVLEETGLKVKVGRPFNAWAIHTPVRQIFGVDFICHWEAGDARLSWEHERYEWLTLEEIQQKDWEPQVIAVYEEAFAIASDLS